MDNKIPCDMIQDLLPLYVDGLTRKTTSQVINEHLKLCEECNESFLRMKAAINTQLDEQSHETQKEINYLKTVKKKNFRNVVCGMGAAALVIAAGIGAKLFFIGSPSESYITTYLYTDENLIHIGGTFYGSASVYSRYKLEKQKDGSQKLIVYSCLASAWNRNGTFNLTLELSDIQKQIDIGGATVERDGTLTSKLANDLYAARNPYIGDVSADGRLSNVLRIGEHLGGFKNELQTAAQPYGWTLIFEDSIRNSAVFEAQMKDFACVLLALTDNLEEVTWSYMVETEEKAVERQTSLTSQEASAYLEESVKTFGESPLKVQELLDKLDIR